MAAKPKNLTGRVFGKFTALRLVGVSGGSGQWLCRCECGVETVKAAKDLARGHAISCGCWRPSNDLVGLRFGRLVVMERTRQSYADRSRLWRCICDCGATVLKRSSELKAGKKRSCGCLITDTQRARLTTHGLSRTITYQREMGALKRSRKRNANGERVCPQRLKEKIQRLGNKCVYCLDGEYEQLDHIVPLSRNGRHVLSNLVPSCARCNGSKHNKLLFTEWMPPNVMGWHIPLPVQISLQ